MIDVGKADSYEVTRQVVREVLRAELIDYLQTSVVRPDQIVTAEASGDDVPVGYTLRVDTDGVARFLP